MWKVMERNRINGKETLLSQHDDYEVAKEFMRRSQRDIEYAWLDFDRYIYLKEDKDG